MQPKENNQRYRRDRDNKQEVKEFEERVVNVDRVARVVKGGRRFRFRALVVIGDKKGRVGVGIAKGADVTAAVAKSVEVAKKNMITVNLYHETIPHDVEAKLGGAQILIKPASAGTGLIAGGVVRTILEISGVHNALSKSLGSTNKVNIAYATIAALKRLVPANQWVTRTTFSKASHTQLADSEPPKSRLKQPAPKTKAKTVKKSAL